MYYNGSTYIVQSMLEFVNYRPVAQSGLPVMQTKCQSHHISTKTEELSSR